MDWVTKWNIGPGMNDRWRGPGKPPDNYTPPKNYTGNDGMVGPGWVPILDELAEKLVALGWDRQVDQIKEKFGTLRFYTGVLTPEMDKLITEAETKSGETCEFCGNGAAGPKRFRGGYWLKTACDDCEDGSGL